MYTWIKDSTNIIVFVMIDSSNVEVSGLGGGFSIWIRKPGGAFVLGVGAKTEIGSGWYQYVATAAECDTLGETAIMVTGAGCLQQNLLANVVGVDVSVIPAGAIEFTYTVTDSITGLPVDSAEVWVSSDLVGSNIVWRGMTDTFGVARDIYNEKPWLDAGTYYFWSHKDGFAPTAMPDTEIVS